MNQIKRSLMVFLFISMGMINAKVLIFTHAYNRPDFVEIQHRTFQAFLEDEYEFVVFSDASDPQMAHAMQAVCDKYGIECVQVPQHIHNMPYLQRWPGENYNYPTVRNVNSVMYSLRTRGFKHDDILVLLDSDMFLVKKMNIRKAMEQYDLMGLHITYNGYPYIWHGLTFFNMKTLPDIDTIDFNCGRINGTPVDGGGHSHFYLKAHPDIRINFFNLHYSPTFRCEQCRKIKSSTCTHMRKELNEWGLYGDEAVYFEQSDNSQFMYDQQFLHYRSGTNWENHNAQYIQQKTNALHTYLNAVLSKNAQQQEAK